MAAAFPADNESLHLMFMCILQQNEMNNVSINRLVESMFVTSVAIALSNTCDHCDA